jgi:hypothetical protein
MFRHSTQALFTVKCVKLQCVVNIVPDNIKCQSQRGLIRSIFQRQTDGKYRIFLSQQLTAFRTVSVSGKFAAKIKIGDTKNLKVRLMNLLNAILKCI